MKVVLYALCWNDADMLGYFFRHYDPVVDRYVIYDDGSDEPTLSILRQHPKVELRRLARPHPHSFVLSEKAVSDECWKESRGTADWVIVTDIDEHLWHPDLPAYLDRCRAAGVTAVPALGFQMVSEEMPPGDAVLSATVTCGAPWQSMMKLSVFNPDAIREIRFEPGRHAAWPRGNVVYPERDELFLLHYKYLGFSRLLARHREEFTGLGPADHKQGWGEEYGWPERRLREEWDRFRRGARDYRDFLPGTGATYPMQGWWRSSLARRLAVRARRHLKARLPRIADPSPAAGILA